MSRRTPIKQIGLRLGNGLHANLVKAAKANDRSLNSEMLERLQSTFDRQDLRSMVENAVRTAITAIKR